MAGHDLSGLPPDLIDFLPLYEQRRRIIRTRLSKLLGARPDEVRQGAAQSPPPVAAAVRGGATASADGRRTPGRRRTAAERRSLLRSLVRTQTRNAVGLRLVVGSASWARQITILV